VSSDLDTIAERFVTASPAPLARFAPDADPAVSFVVVTYGTGWVVVDMLSSLAATVGHVPIEVVVVDNPHPRVPDRTVTELLLATAGVTVLRPPANLGFAGGCELGVRHSRGATLGFLNPDVVLPPGWLDALLAVLDGADPPTIVAPVLVDPDGTIQEAGAAVDRTGTAWANVADPGDTVIAVEYASAACWLVRRADHERIGGFDRAYHPAYYEDVDYAWRVQREGGRTAVHGGVRVVHHRGSGMPDRPPSLDAQLATLRARWPDMATVQPAPEELAAAGWRSSGAGG
jgi:GT2 family glycosyltransferase